MSYLKCKKCGKVFIQDEMKSIRPASEKPKECSGGCINLTPTGWVEKVIDTEAPK